jgi:hypothetical protein
MKYFETKFLDEADEFIAKLDLKTIKKMLIQHRLSRTNKRSETFQKITG